MKSKELKYYNLPGDSEILSEINAKPTLVFVGLILLGIISFFFNVNVVYGATMIITGIVCIVFMPRVTVMEFYANYLVMHNRADKDTCCMIYYSEVSSWVYKWSAKKDELIIELGDGTVEKIEAFSKTIFEAYMYKYLKDKHKKNK